MLQGQANSHAWWTDIRHLLRDFRLISFDYRGTGSTQSAEEGVTWSTVLFARDAVGVLDALEVPRPHVYGTSMGGRVAQMLAIDHPGRVDRLVLACTSPGGPRAAERSNEVRRSLAQGDEAAWRQSPLDLMYTPDWFTQPRESWLLGDPHLSPAAARLRNPLQMCGTSATSLPGRNLRADRGGSWHR